MPTGKAERIPPDVLDAVEKYREKNGYMTFGKVLSVMLKERDPVFIEEQRKTISDLKAKVANQNADIKKWERREQEWKQEFADHIRENRDLIHDYNEKIQDLDQQTRELRQKLRLQPLGNDMDEALSQFQRPEQKPLAFEGMAMEDLINKVDSTREAIDNATMLLTEDCNRLSEGMAVPP